MQAALLGAFGDKVPKAVVAAVEIITQAVRYSSLPSALCTIFKTPLVAPVECLQCSPLALSGLVQRAGCARVERDVSTHAPCTKQPLESEPDLWCSEFGAKTVPVKPILAGLPKLFDAKQEPVRDAVKKLMASTPCPCTRPALPLHEHAVQLDGRSQH